MSEKQEMNLFDLLKLFFCWLRRCFVCLFQVSGKILQLTYRNVWLIAGIIVACVAMGVYVSRPSNRIYKAEALAILNGPTAKVAKMVDQQVEMTFPKNISTSLSMASLLNIPDSIAQEIRLVESFYMIDFQNDSVPDIPDLKRKHPLDDTVNVLSPRHLYFRVQVKDVNKMPQIEAGLLNYLNNNEIMQAQFVNYKNELLERLDFLTTQIQQLDSLEKLTYFNREAQQQLCIDRGKSMIIGEQRTQLLHEDMDLLLKQKEKLKQQITICTAPVVLVSHFVVCPRSTNNRLLCCTIAIVSGYIIGLIIALIAEQFKNIFAFLRKR